MQKKGQSIFGEKSVKPAEWKKIVFDIRFVK